MHIHTVPLTPKQQAGFSLVSGFMEKIMKEADRANAQQNTQSDKRNQQGQGGNFGPQNEEEEKRRLSMQSAIIFETCCCRYAASVCENYARVIGISR